MADQLIRLDSYPFDSNLPTQYDELGYPVFDRGITSHILAACWKQFFSNGIFAAPATNLQITRGTGFSINIAKGIGIIDGHMGGVFNDDGMNIQLTTEARGTKTYSIMLRYDNNNEYRSNWIRVVEGASVAEPETAPNVKEYRLGHVIIPTNSESIEAATIVDERGTSVCPYVAPFEEIDLSEVVSEAKRQANIELTDLASFIDRNVALIQSAIDGTVAGNLQNQIDIITNSMTDSQFLYYCGLLNDEPVGWNNEWLTYEQEITNATEISNN